MESQPLQKGDRNRPGCAVPFCRSAAAPSSVQEESRRHSGHTSAVLQPPSDCRPKVPADTEQAGRKQNAPLVVVEGHREGFSRAVLWGGMSGADDLCMRMSWAAAKEA